MKRGGMPILPGRIDCSACFASLRHLREVKRSEQRKNQRR